jgi:uncharacterized membrane protein
VRSRKLLLGGAALGGVTTALGVAGASVGWWWMVVLAGMVLLSAVLLVALDADRRVRELRAVVRTEIAALDMTGGRAAPTTDDVVGTVRALQAQYTGRLDRLQDTVETTLRRLDERG